MTAPDPTGSRNREKGSGRPDPPKRKSVFDRIATRSLDTNPLVASSIDTLATVGDETGSFSIDMTGALVMDSLAPLPLSTEAPIHLGELDYPEAAKHHLLLMSDQAFPAEIEALAVSVWNEAGWLSPGSLQLRHGSTLEGPWSVSAEVARKLGLPPDVPTSQVYLVRTQAMRGAKPSEQVKAFSEMARAFPSGMPVGPEERTLEFLQRVCRRLDGAIRIQGSGKVLRPSSGSSINLRVYASSWMPLEEMEALLAPSFPEIWNPGPLPAQTGSPFALMAPVGSKSQIIVGVRMETTPPRALRWEMWAKEKMFVYEIVWVRPPELFDLDTAPTRSGRLERNRVAKGIETAAALLAHELDSAVRGGAAIIDEDQFLVGLDAPPLEEEGPRP
ncbi:MAG: hypothetical protein WAS54_06660 [Scrofimicrobium sp.]